MEHEIFEKLLEKTSLNQREIANLIGVSYSQFNAWVRKKRRPKFSLLILLAYKLGCKITMSIDNLKCNVDISIKCHTKSLGTGQSCREEPSKKINGKPVCDRCYDAFKHLESNNNN